MSRQRMRPQGPRTVDLMRDNAMIDDVIHQVIKDLRLAEVHHLRPRALRVNLSQFTISQLRGWGYAHSVLAMPERKALLVDRLVEEVLEAHNPHVQHFTRPRPQAPRDLTSDNETGPRTETRQVGYYPPDHHRYPGAKDRWVTLCTVKGADGPYTEYRIVDYWPWQLVPKNGATP